MFIIIFILFLILLIFNHWKFNLQMVKQVWPKFAIIAKFGVNDSSTALLGL